MPTFTIRDKESCRVIIGLRALLQKLSFIKVDVWAFKNIDLVYPEPFGIAAAEFVQVTKACELGFVVSDADFQKFLKADFQIWDGTILGYCDSGIRSPDIKLECFDTSFWEISTDRPDYVAQMIELGYSPEEPSP